MTQTSERPSIPTRVKRVIVRTIFQLILSISISGLLILGAAVILRGLGSTHEALDQFLYEGFTSVFPSFFAVTFSILLAKVLFSYLGNLPRRGGWSKMEKKLRALSLESRRMLSDFFRPLSIIFFLTVMFLASLIIFEFFIKHSIAGSYSVWLFFLTYFATLAFFGLSRFFMNRLDWADYYFNKCLNTESARDFAAGLHNYNKLLGSSLSNKRLIVLSQCLEEAFKIGKPEDVYKITGQVKKVAESLRKEDVVQADAALVELSSYLSKMLEGHEKELGFAITYPARTRFLDKANEYLVKIFPQFMLFLLWVALLIILARMGVVQFPAPP